MGEMERLLDSVSQPADWKKRVQGISSYTEFILRHSYLLDPPRVQKMKALLSQMARAIADDDEQEAERLFAALDKATDDLPTPIQMLLILNRAVWTAKERGMTLEEEQVRQALSEIESAMQSGAHDRAIARFAEIEPVLSRILGERPSDSSSKKQVEDLPKS
ncbi:MAG: hypothetical protein FJY75_12580 [Candidatus Eisenbacteria bacterium]|uniref:Uncharacterized protein n=1 Tax=Eiseniibacteriota bacterium TaxID=2212470 RepID=A0A938BPT9_UNCEI|nr:hypothetical protein [Candidatus Eisenbacteria bacterium]